MGANVHLSKTLEILRTPSGAREHPAAGPKGCRGALKTSVIFRIFRSIWWVTVSTSGGVLGVYMVSSGHVDAHLRPEVRESQKLFFGGRVSLQRENPLWAVLCDLEISRIPNGSWGP